MANLSPSEKDALARIVNEPALQPYFFRKANNLKWFDALKEHGFFAPDKHPLVSFDASTYQADVWYPAEYLASASEHLSSARMEMAAAFIKVIRDVTKYALERRGSNYRTWWNFAKVLRHVPAELYTLEDARMVSYWLRDPAETSLVAEEVSLLLDSLLQEDRRHDVALEVLRALFRVEYFAAEPTREGSVKLCSNAWEMDRIRKRVSKLSGDVLGSGAADIYLRGLQAIVTASKNDQWSTIWRPAIEEHPQNVGADEPVDVFIEALKDWTDGATTRRQGEAAEFISTLLMGNLVIGRRIALWAATAHDFVFDANANALTSSDFFGPAYRHEYWTLLNKKFSSFSESAQKRLVEEIRNIEANDESGARSEEATAYRQAVWYAALKPFGFESDYAACVRIAGAEPEHPDFSIYSFGGWVNHESVYSLEDILSFSAQEIVQKLNDYFDSYEAESRRFRGPDLEGLCKSLRSAVKKEPVKFHLMLSELAGLRVCFIHEVVEAFAELWKEKSALPWTSIWPRLLAYISAVFARDDFWAATETPADAFVATRTWVVTSVGRLIEAGVRTDDFSIPQDLDSNLRALVSKILEMEAGEDYEDGGQSDPVFSAINSARGQALEALINLALRGCRLAGDKRKAVWGQFEEAFDRELAGPYLEIAALVPMYLPNFLYMSKEWVLTRFDILFPARDFSPVKWRYAMEGYAYVSAVYGEIYGRLRDKGHLQSALNDESLKDRAHERIIQNVGVAYLSDQEPIDSAVMTQIINADDHLAHLIWFIGNAEKRVDGRDSTKIFELWKVILRRLDFSSKGSRQIAARLCAWIELVEVIDDTSKPLLMEVVPYAEEGHNGYKVMEAIARFATKQPLEAADIWEALLLHSRGWHTDEAVDIALASLWASGDVGRLRAKTIASRYIAFGDFGPAERLAQLESNPQA